MTENIKFHIFKKNIHGKTVQVVPIQLPTASKIDSSCRNKNQICSLTQLIFGFISLIALCILYVSVTHYSMNNLHLSKTMVVKSAFQDPTPKFLGDIKLKKVQVPGWGYNISRDVKTYIHPEMNTSILNPTNLCTSTPFLLIVVCSSISNEHARAAIRNTWGNKENLDVTYNFTVQVAFLVGQDAKKALNKLVAQENEIYEDIIQERFIDSYNNLTLKSLAMLKWATSNCKSSKYLLKTDDDMFINIPKLIKVLKARPESKGTLIGHLYTKSKPILNPKNKWYTPKYMYSRETYPHYLCGSAYLMSLDVALKLYQEAFKIPIIHMEDVYVTGMCAERAKLTPKRQIGFQHHFTIDPCKIKSEVISIHKIKPAIMFRIWKKITKSKATC